ncbi:signal peptidase II [Aciduricibacillus chroicocephali]|uniref:Lipoprotein signal peptidase n=1 Tax=Aciduricibacillus chroicocephali TaxID=3054939 RepID=A0ABY9KYI6_9BACI|nr:signal peptidase II [Bacillaceae bacterium 44XB]
MYIYYLLAILVIGLDQWTKWLIVKKMDLYESIPVIDGFFHLTSHRNRGAAWGILEGKMFFFYVVTIVVVAGIVYYMQKHAKGNRPLSVSLALILGGAIGNFIDRATRKEVVDFFDFNIFGYHYPIFNIADSALVIGIVMLLIVSFIEERKKGKAS